MVTIPANFANEAREATLAAAHKAGLNVKHIINEPTAAALYFAKSSGEEMNGRYVVFDLGGGTFDVTIMEVRGQDINVLSSEGVSKLGGDDFDRKIQEIVSRKYLEQSGVALTEEDFSIGEVEELKKTLSRKEEDTLRLRGDGGRQTITVRVSNPLPRRGPSTSGTGVRILLKRRDGDEVLNGERNGRGFYTKPMRGLVVRFVPDPSSPLKIGPGLSVRRWFRMHGHGGRPARLPILAEDQASVSDIPAILEDLPNPSRGRENWIRMGMSLRVIADHSNDPDLSAQIEEAWITWSAMPIASSISSQK